MIEHKHWKRMVETGIKGQHIAIVGYSHYRKEEDADSDNFTRSVMKTYIDGDEKMGAKFFPQIQSYFGFEDRAEFWEHVHFFNFVPECFIAGKKFSTASGTLLERARTRFRHILSVEKPDKVFMFSTKGWNQCPSSLEEDRGEPCKPLARNKKSNWGTYQVDAHYVRVCGFRHPLYANPNEVKSAVQEFLAM